MGNVKRPEGCRFGHIAPMKLTSGIISYESYMALEGLEEISATPVYAELQAFSDNQQDTNRKKPIAYDITLLVRQSSPAFESLVMGQRYEHGRKYTSTNDVQAPVAFAYQQTNSDGTYTNILYYNTTFSRESRSNKTTTDSVEFDSVTFIGRAIPLPTGELDLQIESDDENVVPADLTNFFTKVLMPDDAPPEALTFYNQSVEQQLKEYKLLIQKLEKENKKLKTPKEVDLTKNK